MDATTVPNSLPVVLFLGSGRVATNLCQALASEPYHAIQARSWGQVRALAGFLRPDLLVLAPGCPEELAWQECFAADVPQLLIAADGPGLGWPLPWSDFVTAVRLCTAIDAPVIA